MRQPMCARNLVGQTAASIVAVMLRASSARIEAARRSDLAGICRLLELERLPTGDITEQSLEYFLVCRDGKGVIGAVGIELFGSSALLRSLVVSQNVRRDGLGGRLAAAAEALAKRLGAHSVYLLTTSAEQFFSSRGYRALPRIEAPSGIQGTTQFSHLCPSTAVLMVKP